jgi:diguanylate cyclase (GGDEF)-like protein
MGLIMLDVDDLKLVNDTYGHQAGDQLIQFIGEQCRSQLRQADIPARYAGDEFIIALPGTNLEGSLQVARRIKERIAAGFTIDSQTVLPVSVSIGVSDLDETCFSLETLIARADKALYTAKAAGKNRIGGCNGGEFSVYD